MKNVADLESAKMFMAGSSLNNFHNPALPLGKIQMH